MNRRAFLAAGTLSVMGFSGCLGDTEYRITEATVEESVELLSLAMHLTVADATIEHPAALTLTLENTADDSVRIRSYGVWPFGVLALAPSSTPGEDTWKTTLFSPSYESTDRVEVSRGGASMSLEGTPVTRTLAQGETVSRRYEVRGDDLPHADAYYIVERFEGRASGYSMGDGWKPLEYRVRLTIDKKKRLTL